MSYAKYIIKTCILLILVYTWVFTGCKKKAEVPVLTTTTITNITETNAKGGGNIVSDGGAKITSKGICWSAKEHPTIDDNKTDDGNGTGIYSSSIMNFSPDTRYYVRAYATNKAGTAYGSEVSFIFIATGLPVIKTYPAIYITHISAVSGGNITSDGGSEITSRGVCWSSNQNPTIADNHTNDGEGKGIFVSGFSGLTADSTYYVRAYVTNNTGTFYGNQISFLAASNPTNPTVTTTPVINITSCKATSGGNIAYDNSVPISFRGVCWSVTQNPTISDLNTSDSTGTGSFTSQITNLSANTIYYVRAFAVNAGGTFYGNELSFTTPVVQINTSAVSNISQNSAVGGGAILTDGNNPITERGICWNTLQNPTLYNYHNSEGSGLGSFVSNITGLSANSVYYIRAYAINACGTYYGNEVSIITLSNMPVLTTTPASTITGNSAVTGGDITSDNGYAVTGRGVCWGTGPNPDVTGTFTSDGTGTGIFTSNLTGLTQGTTYYVRAYAVNSAGTSYGNQISFTTDATCPLTISDVVGNSYNAVIIGTQCWMKENLKTTKYSDGADIAIITDNSAWSALSTGAYCDYNNLSSNSSVYGHLYNWFAVNDTRGICPTGWHIPTDVEWSTLIDFLGGSSVAGGKMKETGLVHWQSPNTGATNSSGFTGLPGGKRYETSSFSFMGAYGHWWTFGEVNTSNAWNRNIYYSNTQSYRISTDKRVGNSVRCIKD